MNISNKRRNVVFLIKALQSLFRSRRLRSERIFLRPPKRRDAKKWISLRLESKDFLKPWEPKWDSSACTRSAYKRLLRNTALQANLDKGYAFFLFRNSDKALLGGFNLGNIQRGVSQSTSIGYWIGYPFARKGYMNEAIQLLLPTIFGEFGLHRVEAATLPNNDASRGLLEKLGFKEEGKAREYLKINGVWRDHIIYGLTESDFKNRNK